jgi:hypothetical protein
MSYTMGVVAGETFERLVTYFEDDGVTPIDLSGCSVSWRIASDVITYGYEDDVFVSISDAVNGEISLFLPSELTRSMRDFGLSVLTYALTISFPSGNVDTILRGTLFVDKDVAP